MLIVSVRCSLWFVSYLTKGSRFFIVFQYLRYHLKSLVLDLILFQLSFCGIAPCASSHAKDLDATVVGTYSPFCRYVTHGT